MIFQKTQFKSMAISSSPRRSPPKSLLVDLPDDVIDGVLSRLPIRDAVKTSLLSRTWRHRWRSIPDLHVDAIGSSIAFVDRVLLLRSGPIRSFSLSFEFSSDERSPDHHVDRWLSVLLSVDPLPLRTLILCLERSGSRGLNSTIFFSFRNLIHLELHGCYLPDDHQGQGFPFLETLILDLCSVPLVSDLISNCPLLRNLILTYVDGGEEGDYLYLPILGVRAPNLRSLVFRGALEEFRLISSPLLTTATVDLEEIITHDPSDDEDDDFYYKGDCNLTEAFGHVENIEKLELLTFSLRFLGECGLPERITFCFERLKILTMTVEFEYVNKSLRTALCLLMASPNLEELEIIGSSYKHDQAVAKGLRHRFWQKQEQLLELSKLRIMKFTHTVLARREFQFVLFILSKARGLEKMVMDVSPEFDGIVDKSRSKHFIEYLRASTQAEITITEKSNPWCLLLLPKSDHRPLPPPKSLTDLPDDVIDGILSRLPIHDAARTSVLSRSWRRRWQSVPDLHVDAGQHRRRGSRAPPPLRPNPKVLPLHRF